LSYIKLGQSATTLSGGEVVGVGTPEDIAANPASHTGKYLKRLL
jgi:excinuclease UvrABC ATPase subunit